MASYPYIHFDGFLMRTPMYAYNRILDFQFEDPEFDKALMVASPELYREKCKSTGNYSEKMLHSLYKYWTRACSRSTPFGLFAGCSIGVVGHLSRSTISPSSENIMKTRLDMSYLCSLMQWLERLPEIKEKLFFYPNDSIYRIGEKLRYVEYYYKNAVRIHRLQEVSASECLTWMRLKGKNHALHATGG